MQLHEICELIKAVSDAELSSFEYEENGAKITIKGKKERAAENMPPVPPMMPAVMPQMAMPGMAPMMPQMTAPGMAPMMPSTAMPDRQDPAARTAAAADASGIDPSAQQADCETITSPLVGIFYAAPSEDAAPYVKVGDTVKKGQIVAIVEAMKLMNEIEAECDGVVADILVKNGQSVEYGQPMIAIRAD